MHCCMGTAGARTRYRHNPLAEEFMRCMTLAGRFVAPEVQDPSMGPHARLDIVEFASAEGCATAYDVSVVTALRKDRQFVRCCAREPGYAAQQRHEHKLSRQYASRLPGARLVPLVLEVGGRWHPSVPPLLRRLARAYVLRAPGMDPAAGPSLVLARWMARLSAALIRGNAAVFRRAGYASASLPHEDLLAGGPWPHLVPEGDNVFELFIE